MYSEQSSDESSDESEKDVPPKPTVEIHFLYNGQSNKEVPNDVTHATVAPGVKRIERAAFHSCENLVSIQLCAGLEVIGAAAFGTCSSLTEIVIPNSVNEIARAAFDFCPLLAHVDLPDQLTTIHCRLFYLCRSLEAIEIPKTVTSIGPHAFFECEKLKSVDLPNGLSKICHSAFGGCAALKEVDVPSSVKHVGTYAFRDCKSLALLNLPEGLEEISEGLCENCSSLRALGLPSTVTRIGPDAFRECSNLISLEIPETLQDIGEGAFVDCQVSMLVFPPATKKQKPKFRSDIQDDAENFALEELPIHRICYYQSFHSLPVNLQKLEQAIKNEQKSLEDEYGNTPFHVLAASFAPNFYMFQKLLEQFPADILNKTNYWAQTPVDYLYRSRAPASAQLFEQVLKVTILKRSHFLGLELWKHDVLRLVNDILASDEEARERDVLSSNEEPCGSRALGELRRTLLQFERFEAMALLESALWKHQIQKLQGQDSSPRHYRKKRKVSNPFSFPFCFLSRPESEEKCCFGIKLFSSKPDTLFIPDNASVSCFEATLTDDERSACLVNSGAGVVIPNILPFLGAVSEKL